jgi:replicative DNA helicase
LNKPVDTTEYIPPQAIEAEQSVLGSMMLEPAALFKGVGLLDAEDFYRPAHQDVFLALCDMAKSDTPVDIVTLQEELRKRDQLVAVGEVEYLISLVETVPTASNIDHYAKIVKDKATLRRLITVGTQITGLGRNEEADVDLLVSQAQNATLQLIKRNSDHSRPVSKVITAAIEDMQAEATGQKKHGIKFGLQLLDFWSYGVERESQIFVIAARPSVGKTAMALKIARNGATAGKRSIIFSEETSAKALAKRLLIQQSGIDGHSLRTNSWGSEQEEQNAWRRLAQAQATLNQWGDLIIIDDNPGSITDIVAKTKRHILQRDVDAVIIDYFQIIPLEQRWSDENTKLTIVGEHLQQLTQSTGVPIVLLAQINRSAEKREDKRPNMGDIRGGGNIEAAINKLLILHKPKREEESDKPTLIEFILDKNKDGPTGLFEAHYIKECYDFRDMSDYEQYGNQPNPFSRQSNTLR